MAKGLLERAGFKVDMQTMDWQSMVNRLISKKGPPSEGGWNAFATSWVQVDILDPLMTPFLAATCDKARAGWPFNESMETVRAAYARAISIYREAADRRTGAGAQHHRGHAHPSGRVVWRVGNVDTLLELAARR